MQLFESKSIFDHGFDYILENFVVKATFIIAEWYVSNQHMINIKHFLTKF